MKNLIQLAVTLAICAVASQNLPWILFQVRRAQVHLIIESQASKWPRAMLLPKR
jgi:hypothetical protein